MIKREVDFMQRMSYLSLQAVQEGQASYAHVTEIVRGLERRGWEVTLFSPQYTDNEPGLLARVLFFWRVQKDLVFGNDPPTVVYIRSHFATFPCALWARITGRTVIQEINGPFEDLFISYPFTRKMKGLFIWMSKVQWRWAQACIVVTPQLREWIERESIEAQKVYVVPNGANTELFTPKARTSIKLTAPYVVFFGSLSKWQGIDVILQAVDSQYWPEDLNMVICGEGPVRAAVESAALSDPRIVYLGKVPYREMPGIIAGSIGALVPKNNVVDRSNTGLSPLKIYEALACAVPVVVTDFPGQAELVREISCGYVIAPEDPAGLAKAVNELYCDREEGLAMGKRGRQAIVSLHSWDKRADDTNEIICGCCR